MLVSGDHITIRNGRFFATGVFIGPSKEDDMIEVEAFRNKFEVRPEYVELAVQRLDSQETVEAHLSHELDALRAENAALTEIISMQCDALAAQTETGRPLPAGGPVVSKGDEEWFEMLVDLLELYLLRQLGTRWPTSIADVDLRRLVSHILD
jgi:hypothetical protein